MTESGFPVVALSDEDPATRPFWDGIRAGRLLLERCGACQSLIWYPRGFCPRCGSTVTGWIEASGRGTVYSYTVARRSFGSWAAAAPYVIAYIELAEGPRILSNVIGADPADVRIGLPVEVVFDDDGPAYRFRPAPAAGGPRG